MRRDVLLLVVRSLRGAEHFSGGPAMGWGAPKNCSPSGSKRCFANSAKFDAAIFFPLRDAWHNLRSRGER